MENPRRKFATGLAGLAVVVRGSSRRIVIMRFRPANISLINRRLYLPRLLLTLPSIETDDQRILTGHYISMSELPVIRPERINDDKLTFQDRSWMEFVTYRSITYLHALLPSFLRRGAHFRGSRICRPAHGNAVSRSFRATRTSPAPKACGTATQLVTDSSGFKESCPLSVVPAA
jgi:hypothetical protein